MLAAALIVTIRVYDLYGLSPDTRQEALAVAAETLAQAGVQAIIVDCSASRARDACKTGSADGEIILRIQRHPKDGAHVLGDAIVRGDAGPNTIATVYAAAIAERARRDRHAPRHDRRPRLGARDRTPAARHRTPTRRTA